MLFPKLQLELLFFGEDLSSSIIYLDESGDLGWNFAAPYSITLVPDPRSIKVKSGNSLHDYLQTELWFTKKVKTILATHPADSRSSLGVQFADMLAGVVQSRFEDNDLENFKIIYPKLKLSTLFF